jgi:hypothetical protein
MQSTDQLVEQAIEDGVLDEDFHAPIIRRLDFFSEQTRVPVTHICSSATNHLSPDELKKIQKFPEWTSDGVGGLMVYGKTQRSITELFCAIGGWFIRNKLDARVYTIQELANDARLDGPGLPDCRILLLPDFFVLNRNVNDWIRQTLDTVIYSRYAEGKFTIIYSEHIETMKGNYGGPLTMHFMKTYKTMKI